MFFRFIWYQGEKTMDASLVAFVPVPVALKGHVIGKQRVVLNEMIEISGTTIDPGSRDQPGFTIIGNEEGIEMAKQLISEKLVSSRYVIVLRSTLLHIESFVNNFHSCSEMYIVRKMSNLRKFRQIEWMFIDLTILANFSQICLSEISLTNFHDSSLLHAFLDISQNFDIDSSFKSSWPQQNYLHKFPFFRRSWKITGTSWLKFQINTKAGWLANGKLSYAS